MLTQIGVILSSFVQFSTTKTMQKINQGKIFTENTVAVLLNFN
jgi:hypothetical protein